jgi:hypothetical protein
MEVRRLLTRDMGYDVEYVLVKKPRPLPYLGSVDAVLFERKRRDKDEIMNVSFWVKGRNVVFAEWWMEDYYCSFPNEKC